MNILIILLAALAAFLVGGLWYGPVFGKAWIRLIGKAADGLPAGNMFKIYGLAFLFALLQATGHCGLGWYCTGQLLRRAGLMA